MGLRLIVISLVSPMAILAAATLGFAAAAAQGPASPSDSAAPVASADASGAPGSGPVVVTIQVIEETFKVLLTQPDDVANAWALLAGEEAPSIPNGLVLRDYPGVNLPWSWRLDPDDFEWADMTTEVCDGLPSDVEAGLITSDRYCPWLTKVLAVEPYAAATSPGSPSIPPSGAPSAAP
jgi:hypothetical protein